MGGAENSQGKQFQRAFMSRGGFVDILCSFNLKSVYQCGHGGVKDLITQTIDEVDTQNVRKESEANQYNATSQNRQTNSNRSSIVNSSPHFSINSQRKSHFVQTKPNPKSNLQTVESLAKGQDDDLGPGLWENLNPIIFKRIVSHLPEKDYKNINLVCTSWKSMLADHLPQLKPKGYRLNQFQGDVDNLQFDKFRSVESFDTENLQLDLLFRDMQDEEKVQYCSKLLKKVTVFKRLKRLNMKSLVINVRDLEILGNLRYLEYLNLSFCQIGVYREKDEDRALQVFKNFYKLQTLNLIHVQWVFFNFHSDGVQDANSMQKQATQAWHYFLIQNLRYLPTLRNLHIQNNKVFDKDIRCVYQEILNLGCYSKLESINLSTPIEITQIPSLKAFTHMKNLKHLRAIFYPSSTLVSTQLCVIFEKGLEKLNNLESLQLGLSMSSRVYNYEEQATILKSIFKSLHNLQNLTLECLEDMHWMSIWTAIATIPKLQKFSLKGAMLYGTQNLQRQLPEFFSLESIGLDIRTLSEDILVNLNESSEIFQRLYRLKQVEFSCNGVNELVNLFFQKIPPRSKQEMVKLIIKGKQTCDMSQLLKMDHLKELQIEDFTIRLDSRRNFTFKRLDKLQLLSVVGCKFIDQNGEEDKFSFEWLDQLGDLERLELRNMSYVDEDSLQLLEQFAKLRLLDLSSTGFLYHTDLSLIAYLENLKVLKLNGVPPENHVTKQHNFTWTKSLSSLLSLEELTLDYCTSLRNQDIQHIVNCEKLQKLSLIGCIRLNAKVLKLLKEFKKLRSVDLSSNPFIRPDHCQKQLEDKELLPYGRIEHSQVYTD